MLREPQTVNLEDQKGEERTYTIHKFSAYDGRELATQYPLTGMPKIGDYKANEALSVKMMAYVTVEVGEKKISLSSKTLIENHVPDWEVLAKLEIEIMKYNVSFFQNGKASDFLTDCIVKGKELISQMLTVSSEQLSEAVKQNSGSSKKDTP